MTEVVTDPPPPGGPPGGAVTLLRFMRRHRWLVRLGQAVLTVWVASLVIFALLPLTGDPVDRYIHARGGFNPSPAKVAEARHLLGLDQSLVAQYFTWLGRAVRGDFGISYQTGQPVRPELVTHLLTTLMLAAVAVAVAVAASLVLGLVSAAFAGRWPDTAIRVFSSIGVGIPDFVVGLVLIEVVVVRFHVGQVVSDGAFAHVALPALALALFPTARWTQILRVGLVDATASGYAQVAKARGAGRPRILIHHALPNALPPYLTLVALGIGFIIGGTAVVEAVFSWPGVGLWLVTAVRARDLPEIQAFALLATVAFVALSMTVDLVVGRLDLRTQDR